MQKHFVYFIDIQFPRSSAATVCVRMLMSDRELLKHKLEVLDYSPCAFSQKMFQKSLITSKLKLCFKNIVFLLLCFAPSAPSFCCCSAKVFVMTFEAGLYFPMDLLGITKLQIRSCMAYQSLCRMLR